MGRNIDTVTRRGNRKEREDEREGHAQCGAEGLRDSFVYMRLHAARVYNAAGGERGWGALPYIPVPSFFFFFFIFDLSDARGHAFSRACEHLFPHGTRRDENAPLYSIRARRE